MLEHLQQLDGPVVVGTFLMIVAALLALPGLIVRLGRTETNGPRRESHSETAHRIDAQAHAATSRPVHSGRKAGRTAVTR